MWKESMMRSSKIRGELQDSWTEQLIDRYLKVFDTTITTIKIDTSKLSIEQVANHKFSWCNFFYNIDNLKFFNESRNYTCLSSFKINKALSRLLLILGIPFCLLAEHSKSSHSYHIFYCTQFISNLNSTLIIRPCMQMIPML